MSEDKGFNIDELRELMKDKAEELKKIESKTNIFKGKDLVLKQFDELYPSIKYNDKYFVHIDSVEYDEAKDNTNVELFLADITSLHVEDNKFDIDDTATIVELLFSFDGDDLTYNKIVQAILLHNDPLYIYQDKEINDEIRYNLPNDEGKKILLNYEFDNVNRYNNILIFCIIDNFNNYDIDIDNDSILFNVNI